MLSGPPPLGPGAPPCERLIAYGCATLAFLELHGELLAAAEFAGGESYLRSAPRAVHWLHIRNLVTQAAPGADADYISDVLMAALSAALVLHQRHDRGMPLERLQAGWTELVRRSLELTS